MASDAAEDSLDPIVAATNERWRNSGGGMRLSCGIEFLIVPMELKEFTLASIQASRCGNDLVIEQAECGGGGSSVDWFRSVGTFRDDVTTQYRGRMFRIRLRRRRCQPGPANDTVGSCG